MTNNFIEFINSLRNNDKLYSLVLNNLIKKFLGFFLVLWGISLYWFIFLTSNANLYNFIFFSDFSLYSEIILLILIIICMAMSFHFYDLNRKSRSRSSLSFRVNTKQNEETITIVWKISQIFIATGFLVLGLIFAIFLIDKKFVSFFSNSNTISNEIQSFFIEIQNTYFFPFYYFNNIIVDMFSIIAFSIIYTIFLVLLFNIYYLNKIWLNNIK